MPVESVQTVENYIRGIARNRKCRFEENFLDYDNLRSGYVTANQFLRILRNLLGVPLEDSHKKLIFDKYGVDENQYINWRKFVRIIEGKYDENDFSVPPELKVLGTIESSNIDPKFQHHLTDNIKCRVIRSLLSRINQFITYHGYIIRQCYKQYDIHNTGEVTESQFFRGFPGPKDVSDDEIMSLVQHYKSLTNPGFVNYIAFERDLEMINFEEKVLKDKISNVKNKDVDHVLPKENLLNPSQQTIVERIKLTIRNRGVRVMDFFTDYDKLRHNEVTEHQFTCALLLAVGKEAGIRREEVQILANYYRSTTNPQMINYREFCKEIDSPFQTLYLEKDPLKQIIMPQRGALSKQLCVLSQEDEDRVSKLIEEIKNQVREKRILTFPYFRDYDIGSCFSRSITDTQFERVLHFLGLNLSKEDCRRLCKKFTNSINGCIDYEAFCQRVDEWLTAAAAVNFQADNTDVIHEVSNNNQLECIPEIGNTRCGKNAGRRNWYSTVVPVIKSAGDQWPVDVLIDRIRHLILVNRIPLKPWFHDFDQLRSGYVTRSQFERCLAAAGLTRLGVHDLTPTQANMLADNYMSSTNPHMVNWIKFVYDIDTVFTLPGLEKQPLTRVLPQELFIQPKRGTANWLTATEEMRQNYENAYDCLKTKNFVAFDSLHRGVVTVNNFRQLISMCGFCLSPEEIDAIISRYTNDDGFNYLDFLTHLCSSKSEENEYMYPKRLETLQRTNVSSKEIMETESVVKDAEGIMDMLKAEVYQRSLRLSDWFRDHDKLNHGCLPRITFRRCLGVLNLKINETMLNVLEDRYKGSLPDTIDWRAFTNDVETIFQTPNLEKDPLVEPNAYKPVSSVAKNHLTASIAKSVDEAITKIAAKVRQRRILLPAMFSDFDETHRLTVNQNQFRRVLTTLGLGELLTEKEWTAIFCKYCHRIGLTNNVNYQAFTDDVYTTAGMDPSIP
ncbi:EF Hand type protein [Schistosoma japonicum]|uniref:EF Hand type protein n=1 Tax=Schistosoma japonicum TaxID=6182 RepID=A0A4Z2CSZ5_SCHJA|nr:EF Hand type protein [Schistosoma japonicum]